MALGEKKLREYTRTRLADCKVPDRILFTPEMPRGSTGKVHRPSLKSMIAGVLNV